MNNKNWITGMGVYQLRFLYLLSKKKQALGLYLDRSISGYENWAAHETSFKKQLTVFTFRLYSNDYPKRIWKWSLKTISDRHCK